MSGNGGRFAEARPRCDQAAIKPGTASEHNTALMIFEKMAGCDQQCLFEVFLASKSATISESNHSDCPAAVWTASGDGSGG
jgi:uncharacterized glyoxalase superfamily metalloenzyme YdcJ